MFKSGFITASFKQNENLKDKSDPPRQKYDKSLSKLILHWIP